MKIAIYSPYLDTFGGGERYMMTIAEVLCSLGRVDVLLDKHLADLGGDYLKRELSKRFNLNIVKVNFINGPIGKGSSFLQRFSFLKKYDILFYLTDGSIFIPSAKRNIMHIQTPLAGQANALWGKLKLKQWDLIIYNSEFTKKNSEKFWPLYSQVIYPPVDVDKIKPLNKKNYILSVGRFFGYLKDKKHALLIETFKKMFADRLLTGWSLHLVGSASEGDKPYVEQLRKLANNLPIFFHPNLEYDDLIRFYGESKIYWHASGYGEGDPTKMEHFGISTAEAMAGGCVPVVLGKGGQIEIVEHTRSGFLWETVEQLKKYTLMLSEKKEKWQEMSRRARARSRIFNEEKFTQEILHNLL
ncbi:MAG: glycosyltransferase family 4 protein [Patescibacteria group bacterium]